MNYKKQRGSSSVLYVGAILIVILVFVACSVCYKLTMQKLNNYHNSSAYKSKQFTDGNTTLYDGTVVSNKDSCIVTMYPSVTANQANIYTITYNGKLIIIDGGWTQDADLLRNIIYEHNNHVDAWIITHPHRDHAGAFNAIFSDPQGITIDTIYDNGYDYDFIEAMGEPYDDITYMEDFYSLTKDLNNVIHLKRDEKVNICDLNVEVFNCFDDVVKNTDTNDYQNNGALCIKFTHKEDSFLFTSDIKAEMNTYLYDTYKEKLSAKYLQASHHGNWGFSNELYDIINPSVVLVDLPDSIIYDGSHPAAELITYLQSKNISVCTYSNGKVTFCLN